MLAELSEFLCRETSLMEATLTVSRDNKTFGKNLNILQEIASQSQQKLLKWFRNAENFYQACSKKDRLVTFKVS